MKKIIMIKVNISSPSIVIVSVEGGSGSLRLVKSLK